jgi:hypothetical protein
MLELLRGEAEAEAGNERVLAALADAGSALAG